MLVQCKNIPCSFNNYSNNDTSAFHPYHKFIENNYKKVNQGEFISVLTTMLHTQKNPVSPKINVGHQHSN